MSKYEIASDSDDDVPFACGICRKTFVNPIITKWVLQLANQDYSIGSMV